MIWLIPMSSTGGATTPFIERCSSCKRSEKVATRSMGSPWSCLSSFSHSSLCFCLKISRSNAVSASPCSMRDSGVAKRTSVSMSMASSATTIWSNSSSVRIIFSCIHRPSAVSYSAAMDRWGGTLEKSAEANSAWARQDADQTPLASNDV